MKVDKELLKGSTVILILSLLDRQPMYGYGMIKEIEKTSGGVFAFKEGTLYPILHALEAKGLVESYWMEAQGARRRKYYRITDTGKLQLQEKKTQWAVFRSAVDKILGGGTVYGIGAK